MNCRISAIFLYTTVLIHTKSFYVFVHHERFRLCRIWTEYVICWVLFIAFLASPHDLVETEVRILKRVTGLEEDTPPPPCFQTTAIFLKWNAGRMISYVFGAASALEYYCYLVYCLQSKTHCFASVEQREITNLVKENMNFAIGHHKIWWFTISVVLVTL